MRILYAFLIIVLSTAVGCVLVDYGITNPALFWVIGFVARGLAHDQLMKDKG